MATETLLKKAMLDLYEQTCQETNGKYVPHDYRGLILERGAIDAARYLLSGNPQKGFTDLILDGKPHLTFESYIIQHPEFHGLIGPSYIDTAKKRLKTKP
ncbi:MAG: hypothetical protein AB7F43_14610 [Bacteriovoracia bacterium]